MDYTNMLGDLSYSYQYPLEEDRISARPVLSILAIDPCLHGSLMLLDEALPELAALL